MRTAQDMIVTPSLPAGRSSIIGRMIGCSRTVLQRTMLATGNAEVNSMLPSCMHGCGQHAKSSLHPGCYASSTTTLSWAMLPAQQAQDVSALVAETSAGWPG